MFKVSLAGPLPFLLDLTKVIQLAEAQGGVITKNEPATDESQSHVIGADFSVATNEDLNDLGEFIHKVVSNHEDLQIEQPAAADGEAIDDKTKVDA